MTPDHLATKGKEDRMALPRLMKTHVAASYLGISPSKLRDLPIIPRVDGKNVLYDRLDLDDYADSLPYREKTGGDEWQRAFG